MDQSNVDRSSSQICSADLEIFDDDISHALSSKVVLLVPEKREDH